MDALTFLQSVSGFAQAQQRQAQGSAARPNLLGTIDPAYTWADFVGGTLPKVTFDGESTLSGKRYAHLSSYVPRAGDRVLLVPVGTTYLIVGSFDGQPGPLGILDHVTEPDPVVGVSGTPVTLLTSAALTPVRSGRVWKVTCQARGIDPSASSTDIFVKRLLDNGTPVGDAHDPAVNTTQSPFEPLTVIIRNVTVTAHTFTAQYVRATAGATTATVSTTTTSPIWMTVEDMGPTPAHL